MAKKKLISITIDPDLHEWFKDHAKDVKKTVSGLFNEHIYNLSASQNTPKVKYDE